MSPTLNGSLEIQRFERIDVIEIRNGIMFDFYTELPHIHVHVHVIATKPKVQLIKGRKSLGAEDRNFLQHVHVIVVA